MDYSNDPWIIITLSICTIHHPQSKIQIKYDFTTQYNRIGKMWNFQNHVISKKNSLVKIGNRNREIKVVIRCYFQHHQNPQRKFHRWKLYENFKKKSKKAIYRFIDWFSINHIFIDFIEIYRLSIYWWKLWLRKILTNCMVFWAKFQTWLVIDSAHKC